MVHLESIEVKGLSDVGPFRGTLPLSPGLQVVSAHNSHGKSLAATTIVWCLGCTAPGFLDSGLTVFASTPPRPARGGRVAPGPGFGSRTSPASTARCTSA